MKRTLRRKGWAIVHPQSKWHELTPGNAGIDQCKRDLGSKWYEQGYRVLPAVLSIECDVRTEVRQVKGDK